MIGRRTGLMALAAFAAPPPARAAAGWQGLPAEFARIERAHGGRLGVAVMDAGMVRLVGHRDGERFPMNSTFKALLAGAVLARVDAGRERLDRVIRFGRAELVSWSPVTESQAGGPGMSVAALMEATTSLSDNTAANLLLRSLGGPAELTGFLRRHGDTTTRLDRVEPAMTQGRPGDPRDTTTPLAMVGSLHRLLLGEVLRPPSRERLVAMMVANRTGGPLLRARLPEGWRIADRSGAGGFNSRGAIGVVWPGEGRGPVVIAAFLTEGPAEMAARDAALAEVGGAIYAALG